MFILLDVGPIIMSYELGPIVIDLHPKANDMFEHPILNVTSVTLLPKRMLLHELPKSTLFTLSAKINR